MGQKPSHPVGGGIKKKLPFPLFPRWSQTTQNLNPEQPIKFQYKTRRKNNSVQDKRQSARRNDVVVNNLKVNDLGKPNQSKNTNVELKCKLIKTQNGPVRTKSEPSLVPERTRERHRHRGKSIKTSYQWNDEVQQFGYEIKDVDAFLTRATIEKPANIPVVLAFPSVLYQTRIGGYQAEISLPLGMVVNAVFKNGHWLYVQTPHAEEGYVSYAACLPLGIIPQIEDDQQTPCWEKSTDVFPKPSGNMTDTEKLSSKSDCETVGWCSRYRESASTCGERSVDRLYLRATAIAKGKGIRQTLLVINDDYKGNGKSEMSVKIGEVVFLLNADIPGWFLVKNKEGAEGYIPAAIAGHGFL